MVLISCIRDTKILRLQIDASAIYKWLSRFLCYKFYSCEWWFGTARCAAMEQYGAATARRDVLLLVQPVCALVDATLCIV